VKLEIVIPILVNKTLAAELDIESYFAETFNKSEQEFDQACANVIADYLAKQKCAVDCSFSPPR
jgi:putative methionine-R-sulfoxide reductase with GAF domain